MGSASGQWIPNGETIDLPSIPCCCDTRRGHVLLLSEKGQPANVNPKCAITWREESVPSPQSSFEVQQK